MSFLVTGRADYIESHTCKIFAHQGHTVVIYNNLFTGYRKLVHLYSFIYRYILNTERLHSCIRQHCANGVGHFVSSAYCTESIIDQSKCFSKDVDAC
jgi:UDP-glucose 4-epimerase